MSKTSYILKAKKVSKHYEKGSMFNKKLLKAVDDVSLSVKKGEIFSIVGESGCGKSTLAKIITQLITSTAGSVELSGKKVSLSNQKEILQYRKDVQMVFQDPYSSINPRKRVRKAVKEPLYSLFNMEESLVEEKFLEIMNNVGISESLFNKYPHELSGGQLQRVAIARALIVAPKILVADEPIAALDVSIQSQILNLLLEMQKKTGLTIIFISHDLGVVKQFSDRVAIMYLGNIVEQGKSEEVFNNPTHPYTKSLISSIPKINTVGKTKLNVLEGEVPSLFNVPTGCPFHPRCIYKTEDCTNTKPKLSPLHEEYDVENSNSRLIACYNPLNISVKENIHV